MMSRDFCSEMRMAGLVQGCLMVIFLTLSGCSLSFAEHETVFRIDEKTDTLELLSIYRGVTASKDHDDTVREALEIVMPAAKGERRFAVSLWGDFDLDDPELVKELDEGDAFEREVLQFAQGVSVTKAGLFLDEKGRLSGYQRIQIKNIRAGVDLLNQAISRLVLSGAEDWEDFVDDTPFLDSESRDLLVRYAQRGDPWLKIKDGEIEVMIPITPASANSIHQEIIKDSMGDVQESSWNWFLRHLILLRHYSVEEDGVLLRFGSPEDGVFYLAKFDDEVSYRPALRESLELAGMMLETDTSSRKLLKEFGVSLKEKPAPQGK